MIRITAKRDGFRRCGVAHITAGKEWPDDAWSKEQLARLEADPMLVVQRTDDAKTGAESTTPKPAAANTKPASHKAPKGNKTKAQDAAPSVTPVASEEGKPTEKATDADAGKGAEGDAQ